MNSSKTSDSMTSVGKKAAFEVKDGDVLGLGSGSAVSKFGIALGQRIKSEKLRISALPSSLQARILAKENGIPLMPDSAHCPVRLDLCVDGADQVSLDSRSMVKGGGGQLLKEKIIITSSKRTLILVDSSKLVKKLTFPVPVEVVQFAVEPVSEKLGDFNAKPSLRRLDKGYPYYTESGNLIIDAEFNQIDDPVLLESKIKCTPGVVEAGLFNCRVDRFIVGNQDGTVDEL